MRKFKQKEFREMARMGMATNITNYSLEECQKLNERNLSKEGYSSGIYGINGGLLKDIDTGEFYVITVNNSTLLYFF